MGRGRPAPIPVPAGVFHELQDADTIATGLHYDTKEGRDLATTINTFDAMADLQRSQGDAAGMFTTIGRFGELHAKAEAAINEENYRVNEERAEAEGTRFQRSVDQAGTIPENWHEAGPGETDQLTDVEEVANHIDLTTVPDAVADGISSLIRLKAEQETHDLDAKHYEAQGTVMEQNKDRRNIIKNGFKQVGYYFTHLAPGVALGVIAGLLAGPLGIGAYAVLTGLGVGIVSEMIGGISLYFNEIFHSLVESSIKSNQKIEEARKKITQIRMDVLSGNMNLVAAIGELQQMLWANAGFVDANGNRVTNVKNDDRIKGAFNRTGGVPKGIRDTISALATA